MSGKRLVLFGALPLLLLGGGTFVAMDGMLGEKPKPEKVAAGAIGEHGAPPGAGTIFYDLPELLVNLNSTSRRPSFLKIRVSLEVKSPRDVQRIETMRPRIIDNFQVYLRELRLDDLRGSAGIYRLREELLARVNAAVQPAQVSQVLFKEVLVQ